VPVTAIRNALLASWPPAQVSDPVVLHGDYWPGNVLWRDGRLVGVIDWEEAVRSRCGMRIKLSTAATRVVRLSPGRARAESR